MGCFIEYRLQHFSPQAVFDWLKKQLAEECIERGPYAPTMTGDRNYSVNVENHRPDVIRVPQARFTWHIECIAGSAGHQLSGGSGASGWGCNQSNIVRFDKDVYAMFVRRIGDLPSTSG